MNLQHLRHGLACAVLSTAAACSADYVPPVEQAVQIPAATSRADAPARAEAVAFLRGYYEARDGGLFTACGETSRRRVTSVDPVTAAALVQANALQDRPRFLMAEGDLRARDAVEIGRFNIISGDAWDCDSRLDEIVMAARGSAILWNLEVTRAAASFTLAPAATPEVFAFKSLQGASGEQILTSGSGEASLIANLHADACVEPFTDTTFGWSISVHAIGKEFSGCAWRGLAAP